MGPIKQQEVWDEKHVVHLVLAYLSEQLYNGTSTLGSVNDEDVNNVVDIFQNMTLCIIQKAVRARGRYRPLQRIWRVNPYI